MTNSYLMFPSTLASLTSPFSHQQPMEEYSLGREPTSFIQLSRCRWPSSALIQ